jgi:hypothetical protein
MAKAELLLQSGTKVFIEGTSEEVKQLLEVYSTSPGTKPKGPAKRRTNASKKRSNSGKSLQPKGPLAFIRELKEESFFKAKRTITEIQNKLEEKGHIYAQASLSTPLLRLTRSGELGRLKEGGIWRYVHRGG